MLQLRFEVLFAEQVVIQEFLSERKLVGQVLHLAQFFRVRFWNQVVRFPLAYLENTDWIFLLQLAILNLH